MPHEDINFVGARDVVIVGNDVWQDDKVTDNDIDSDLSPGDEVEVARIESTEPNVKLAVRAVGVTRHYADFNTDPASESVVEYRYEHKVSKGDTYNGVPGLETTLALGSISEPVEPVPGAYIGPVAGFRIVFFNRTEGASSPQTVGQHDMGAEIHARILRDAHADAVQPVIGPGGDQ